MSAAEPADDTGVWTWIAGGLLAWLGVASVVAVVLGRGIAMADRAEGAGPVDPVAVAPASARATKQRPRRLAVPIPPVGMALAAGVCALMTVGYVVRLAGATGEAARVWSMDAPYSVPRTYIAVLFAVAAVAAAAAATRSGGRRAWWSTVALVAGVLATVKFEGTLHYRVVSALTDSLGAVGATILSVTAAGSVLAVMAFVSRAERRDRRRILTCLGCYAAASVGLSALSTVLMQQLGSGHAWFHAATYVEESAEGLAAVAFLFAVLVGVAPRLVLPASWVLRREGDAQAVLGPVSGDNVAHG